MYCMCVCILFMYPAFYFFYPMTCSFSIFVYYFLTPNIKWKDDIDIKLKWRSLVRSQFRKRS